MRALLALALFGACIGTIAAADCSNPLSGWAQCGGRSNCNGDPNKCGDMQWKTYCCPSGYSCTRQGEWFWQCQPGNGAPSTPPPNNGGGGGGGGWTPPPPPSGPGAYKPDPPVPAKKIGSDWDWGQPLGLSFLFYEAQRSGKLPANNRVAWRGDAGLDHKTNDGRDVTGGWYDAGDNVKFNFPMAWSAHVMAWSIVDFADGYYKAGQLGTALANVKWVTDYFIKCIGDGQKDIVVQVGSGSQDHGIWGRPEDIKNPVPVYTVNPGSPGSDVVAAMGATLGAASVAFSRADEAYSKQLLASAIKAYNFATQHIGKYSDSVSDAGAFYRSSNVYDDIAANAIWLYIATGQETYKKAAFDYYMKHYKEEDGPGVWDNFDWDSHSWAAVVLLQRYFPQDPILKARMTKFVRAWTEGVSDIVKFTPKGLAYSGPWGSLRHVGNAMFLLKAWAVGSPNADPAIKQQIDCTVRKQLGYILGDTGRSFVVGYGTNPPARPHHRSSSCPPLGVQCTWDYYNNPGPNPHTLYGALVGGPGANDDYTDDRNDYIKNEVATDYNAGFTGALAAAARGLLPCQASAAAGAPVFTATVEPLPKMAIMVLPAPYLKRAMEVVSGERTDATPLPQPLPAIEAPKVEEPAPKVPEPVPAPMPAPVPAPAPKPFRPPQSLCFNWNDRTHQYEATTAEARDFLAALLGLKESSKSKAGLQGVIDVAARRVVKGPLGAHSAPVARKAALEPEHECVCPTHECAPCPTAACPTHECAPCPTAAAAVKAAEPAPVKAAAPTEPAASKKKKPLTKTKTEDKPPAKQVPETSGEEEPAPASAAPAPTAQAPAQQPPAPQAQEAQQQEEGHDEEQEEEEKQEEEEEENQLSDSAAQAKPDQPSAGPAPKAQQPEQKHQHMQQNKPEQQQKQPAPEQQPAPAKQEHELEQQPEQQPAPAKQEQKPEQQPEQQPAPAQQEHEPEQQPEQQPAPAQQEQNPAAANPEQQQPQPLQPQQPGTAPHDPATPATDGAAEGQKKKKKHKKKKAAASPAEQPAGAASPEEQPAPAQSPAAANPVPEQQQPAPQTPAAAADAKQPPAAPSKPHKKKKETRPKVDVAEGSKSAAQPPSETEPPAVASDSADKEPSSGMTREKDLDNDNSSSSGSTAPPTPASTDAPTAGAEPAKAATPIPADSHKQESSSTPTPDNAAAQNPDSSKAEKKKKKKRKKARKALNEADSHSAATPADAATAAAAAAVVAVPADAATAATAAAEMLTAAEV